VATENWTSMAVVAAGTAGIDDRVREWVTAYSVRSAIGCLPRGRVGPLAPALGTARRPTASFRTDYRKLEQDRFPAEKSATT
jgi:hypothetical protein